MKSRILKHALLWTFLGLLSVSMTGCKADDDPLTERPWNSPRGWETGLPSTLTEGR